MSDKMSDSPFLIKEHVISSQYIREYPGATLHDQEDDFKLHIKQYIPKHESQSSPGAVTIIGAHANGFPKVLSPPTSEAGCELRLNPVDV